MSNLPAGTNSDLKLAVIARLEREIGAAALERLIPDFTSSVAEATADIMGALDADNLKKARETAHTLGGLCAQFGAAEVEVFAKYIETEIGSVGEARKLMIDMKKAVAALNIALSQASLRLGQTPGNTE